MADTKVTALAAKATLAATDLMMIVDDPSGTPVNKRATLSALAALGTIKAIDGANVATSESTASTSYTNLATSGPSVTLTTGTSVIVCMSCVHSKTTAGNSGFMSVDISSATTVAASDANGVSESSSLGTAGNSLCRILIITGLNAGSNVFKLQYRVDGGTFSFSNRSIVVLAI